MINYDLCVVGGGPTGCAASYIASKLGLKTVLVEKNNYLGGLMTGGLVVPCMNVDTSNINIEFYSDLIKYSKKFDAQIKYSDGNNGWFNPNILKIVLDKMMDHAHVDTIFEMCPKKVIANKNNVKSVEFESNLLSLHIYSKYFLDASGDGILFKLLNDKFINENEQKQPPSLRFIMSGVNIEELKNFLIETDKDRSVTNYAIIDNQTHLTTAYTWDDKPWALKPIFDKAINDGILEPSDTAYFQIFTVAGAKDSIAFNSPRLKDYNTKDPLSYSKALSGARYSIFRLSNFVKKYLKGFENAYISEIADITGHRESNRINPKTIFNYPDVDEKLTPDNPILSCDYPVDIHSNKKNSSVLTSKRKVYLEIDSLISKKYDNLYGAGKILGADKLAHSALRTQISCMSMGEGVARHVFSNIKKY